MPDISIEIMDKLHPNWRSMFVDQFIPLGRCELPGLKEPFGGTKYVLCSRCGNPIGMVEDRSPKIGAKKDQIEFIICPECNPNVRQMEG